MPGVDGCPDAAHVQLCLPDGSWSQPIACTFGTCELNPWDGGGYCKLSPVSEGEGAPGERQVHVAWFDAVDQQMAPVEGAFVILGSDPATPHQGLTGPTGTLGFEGLPPNAPWSVSVVAEGFTATTWVGLEGDEANVRLRPLEPRRKTSISRRSVER